jgi:hypothetical protein
MPVTVSGTSITFNDTSVQTTAIGMAKVLVNFNGSFGTSPFTIANGGIRAAFNVSSVTDNGVGDYTVNFTNDLGVSIYATTFGTDVGAANYLFPRIVTQSTGSVRVKTTQTSTTGIDCNIFCVAIFV